MGQLNDVHSCCDVASGSEEKNKAHYNTTTPPQYNVANIDIPVALFYGDKDDLVSPPAPFLFPETNRMRARLTPPT